jgi:hydrogenase maturation protease
MKETLVLAIGNTLMGDDGLAQALLTKLEHYTYTPPIHLLDGGTQGLYLLPSFRGIDRLLILDATDSPAGTVNLWQGDEVPRRMRAKKLSAHDVLFDEVLAIAALLGQLPPVMALVGIGIEQMELGQGLSQTVQNNIPLGVEQALAVLASWGIAAEKKDDVHCHSDAGH